MGGKAKQSQRTKNNVRPSSSGRSAELLQVVGKVGQGGPPALFPTLQPLPLTELDNIDPAFAMCFKRLTKKDPITKTKALQELKGLLSAEGSEAAAARLAGAWGALYPALARDASRGVREAAQACHGALAARAGRALAPALRQVLPAWLAALHDPSPIAAAAAKQALASTFPEGKLPEVVTFCKTEVMAFVKENIIEKADVIPKDNAEDAAEAADRAAAGALRALQQMVLLLPHEQHEWLWAAVAPLLRHERWWALPQRAALRAAWCGAVGALSERCGARWSVQCGARAARVLLTVATAAPLHVWPCLLQLLQDPNWPEWMDKKQELCDKLIKLLENGGWGDSRYLSMLLVPLLRVLLAAQPAAGLQRRLLHALLTGSEKKSVMNSKSEREHWMSCFISCLPLAASVEPEACGAALRQWLLSVLRPEYARPAAERLIPLLISGYDGQPRTIWHCLGSTLQNQADEPPKDDESLVKLVESHVTFLLTLKAFRGEAKKKRTIKFEDVQEKTDTQLPIQPSAEATSESPNVYSGGDLQQYTSNVRSSTLAVCSAWLSAAAVRPTAVLPLLPLVRSAAGPDLWLRLAADSTSSTPADLYHNSWRPWLTGDGPKEAIVELVFLLMLDLDEAEQDSIYDTFAQLPADAIESCAAAALSHPHVSRPAAARWLSTRPAGAALAAAVARLLPAVEERATPAAEEREGTTALSDATSQSDAVTTDASSADTKAVQLFSAAITGEMLFSEEAISEVVSAFSDALQPTAAALDRTVPLAARLAAALAAGRAPRRAAPLATALLRLAARLQGGSSQLSQQSWLEARAAWQDALAAGVLGTDHAVHTDHTDRADHANHTDHANETSDGLREVLHVLQELGPDLCASQVEHIGALCPYLLVGGDEALADRERRLTDALLHALDAQRDAAAVEACALRADIVEGRIQVLFPEGSAAATAATAATLRPPARCVVLRHCRALLLLAAYLRTLRHAPTSHAASLYYRAAVLESLVDSHQHWSLHSLVAETHARLRQVLSADAIGARRELAAALRAAAASDGYYWPRAHRYFTAICPREETGAKDACAEGSDTADDVTAEGSDTADDVTAEGLSGDGYYHSLQEQSRGCTDPQSELRVRWALLLRALRASGAAGEGLGAAGEDLDLDRLVDAYYRNNDLLLYDRDISVAEWVPVCGSGAACALLAAYAAAAARAADSESDAACAASGVTISDAQWDFIALAACSLGNSLLLAAPHWTTAKVSQVLVPWCSLVHAASQYAVSPHTAAARQQEWSDVFEPELARLLREILTAVLESASEDLCCAACAALRALEGATNALRGDVIARDDDQLRLAVECCCEVLMKDAHPQYKVSAHALLLRLERTLVLRDADRLAAWSGTEAEGDGSEQRVPLCLDYYRRPLQALQPRLDEALQHVVVGEETISPEPHTPLHGLVLGQLLLADAALRVSELARGDLVHHYIQHIREHSYWSGLIATWLRLIPEELLALSRSAATPSPALQPLFSAPPSLQPSAASSWLRALSCRGLRLAAGGAAAGCVRGWWGAATPRASLLLERLLQAYVTPPLVKDQLARLQRRKDEIPDAEIEIHWSSYEVQCWLTVDERRVPLTVTLGRAHPLQLPVVKSTARTPVGTHWLALYLSYQNGSVLEALRMWALAVTKRVSASPACYVCYCRLHPAGGLPSAPCRTCRNTFHTHCLRKWFATSGKSTCPLCRADF